MNGYENLYMAMIPGLAEHYEISDYDFRNNPHATNVALCRSHLHKLMLIELYLHEHRIKFKNAVLNLDGGAALHHLVFQKTNWTPESIRSMGNFDLLWVLLDDLVPGKLSEKAQSYLEVISKNVRLPKIHLMSYAGWQIGSGDQYLKDE
ncbi:ECs1072 family phage-associated protein [Citrobacter freundii]|uniref:ECs1072 family phage-associated protein n=1 Tax=Citrobacter freundii TaxID=546 RepID=UPI0028BDA5F8|nr:hypothetical protein [Citrobacter freundii]MDT7328919.1 hypothetical protein [Citrobacter freundii]MDT7402499.1 hypothetical protein [Citrobacter freundii]HBV7990568.1 hypothetical protein [Citrobacter freundii]